MADGEDRPVQQPDTSVDSGDNGDSESPETIEDITRRQEEEVADLLNEQFAGTPDQLNALSNVVCDGARMAKDASTEMMDETLGQAGQFDELWRNNTAAMDSTGLYAAFQNGTGDRLLPQTYSASLSAGLADMPVRDRAGTPPGASPIDPAAAAPVEAVAATPGAPAVPGAPAQPYEVVAAPASPGAPTDTNIPRDQPAPVGDSGPVAGDSGIASAPRRPNAGPGLERGDSPTTMPEGWGRQPTDSTSNRRTPDARDTPQGVQDTIREMPGLTDQQRDQYSRQMGEHLTQIEANLRARGLSDAQVAEQMTRQSAALNDMLRGNSDGSNRVDGILKQPLERVNLALSASGSVAYTESMNQAGTNECALTSINRAAVSGNDPASAMERAASAVNRGGFYSPGQNGHPATWTDLSSVQAGLRPSDHTGSSHMYDRNFHSGNQMNLFLQIGNQAVGERMAQYEGGHYQAANAGTRTGEQFTDANGNRTHESPNTTANNTARALHEFTGQRLLMHESMARELSGNPPSQYIATFRDEAGMRAAMDANLQATGSRDNPMWNQAAFLPGQRPMAGHTHHLVSAMNNADGTMGIRNNWGASHNIASGVTYDQMDRATNIDRQRQEVGTGGGGIPGGNTDTRAEPGGKNDKTNLEKVEENNKKKQEEEDAAKKAKEAQEKQQKAQLDAQSEAQAQAEFNQALSAWQNSPADKRGEKPDLESFRRRHARH